MPRSPTGRARPRNCKDGKLFEVVCKAGVQPIPYTLDEPRQGRVAVRFVSGQASFCGEFVAESTDDDRAGKFMATTDVAPAACPPAPGPCP